MIPFRPFLRKEDLENPFYPKNTCRSGIKYSGTGLQNSQKTIMIFLLKLIGFHDNIAGTIRQGEFMKTPIIAREAVLNDIDTIIKFRIDFLKELGNIKTEAECDILSKKNRSFFLRNMASKDVIVWFIDSSGKIASTGAILLFKRPPVTIDSNGLEAYVFNLYTVPEFRRQGYATAIMHKIMEEAKKMQCSRTWLHATEEGALLYEKLGYRKKEDVMEFIL
jgi:ribosomal protein S18 acetylase RimI-like enzyme